MDYHYHLIECVKSLYIGRFLKYSLIYMLNIVGLWVDSLPLAVKILTEKGIKFTPGGIRKGAGGHDVAFIHPKSAVGVLVELVQAPPEIINQK